MRYLLAPEVLAVIVGAILGLLAWSLRMLYRIARDSGDTHRKVDTLWQWWLLHVAKMDLPAGDDGTKRPGFTGDSPH